MDRTAVLAPVKMEMEREISDKLFYKMRALMVLYPPSHEFQKCFAKDMFLKSNPSGFLQVMHYLFRILDPIEFKKRFYWPITDKRSETQFRTSTVEYLKHLQSKYDLKSNVTTYLTVMPGGYKFLSFLYDFVSFVVSHLAEQAEHRFHVLNSDPVANLRIASSININEYCQIQKISSEFLKKLDCEVQILEERIKALQEDIAKLSKASSIPYERLIDPHFMKAFAKNNERLCGTALTKMNAVKILSEPIDQLKSRMEKLDNYSGKDRFDSRKVVNLLMKNANLHGMDSIKSDLYHYDRLSASELMGSLLKIFEQTYSTVVNSLNTVNEESNCDEFISKQLRQNEFELVEIHKEITEYRSMLSKYSQNCSINDNGTFQTPVRTDEQKKTNIDYHFLSKLIFTPPIKLDLGDCSAKPAIRLPLQPDILIDRGETRSKATNSLRNRSKLRESTRFLMPSPKPNALESKCLSPHSSTSSVKSWKNRQFLFGNHMNSVQSPRTPKRDKIADNPSIQIQSPMIPFAMNNCTQVLAAVKKVRDDSLNMHNLSISPSGRLDPLVSVVDIPKIQLNNRTIHEELQKSDSKCTPIFSVSAKEDENDANAINVKTKSMLDFGNISNDSNLSDISDGVLKDTSIHNCFVDLPYDFNELTEMGSLFRSEEMTLCQLFLQSEAAYACVSEMGELGLVQFRDLNPDVNAFQRKFVNEVRRCDEMERKLRYLEKEIKKDSIPMLDTGESPEAPQPREMIDLEATFEKLENELREVNQNAEALKRNFLELTELKHILRKTQVFFDEQEGGLNTTTESMTRALITDEVRTGHSMGPVQLGYLEKSNEREEYLPCFVAGVILREKLPAFERMLWRACRGNVFLRQAMIESPLEDPSNGDQVYKSVFIIFFQGDQLKSRVKKICEGFRATLYPCPEAPADRREMAMGVMTRIEDLNTVLGQTQDHRHRVLVAAAKNLKNWFVKVRKIKAIYHTLNLFNLDVTQKCLIAECWVPVLDIETIQLALRRGTERSGSSVPPILNRMQTFENPPTYNRTNKFTKAFQALIDAYGVASYREMNPAPYTIITFPFLFAVMFGDLGHGAIMALFGLWMIRKEKGLAAQKTDNEIWNIFFGGRYIIFLMGVFSMYTGLIYNDIFSKSLNIFGSHWHVHYNVSTLDGNKYLQLNPETKDYDGTPYPFGMDPIWQVAGANKIIFQNAYKMKISIIFGVIHMIFGVSMSWHNHTYFKNRLSLIYEFIPQIIFLFSLFFYMVLLMFIKWNRYAATNPPPYSASCAPSILITFIDMVLFNTPKQPPEKCEIYMFSGQAFFQKVFVLLAVACIPVMLLGKPLQIRKQRKLANVQPITGASDTEVGMANGPAGSGAGGGHHDEEEMSEIFIHQGIHTIEYVLGSVSHTASYLRLWALSLAHAQLAEVLWNMVLSIGLKEEGWFGGIMLTIVFAFWAVLTVGILVLMEGLSAFLHTLRLHWVEFQSKFYQGQGYAFQPFSFDAIIENGGVGGHAEAE